MLAGHYGVGLALKRADPRISLGVLFLAVQFVDILWAVLVLLGVERVAVVPGITAANPLEFVRYPYTHSLAATLVWSAVAYLGTRFIAGGKRTSLAIATAVGSHFVLDLIVHRPDLPLAFNGGDRLGLGLWNHPAAALAVEWAILAAGLALYWKVGRRPKAAAALMLFPAAAIAVHEPPPSGEAAAIGGLVLYVIIAAVAWWLDRPLR